MTKKTADAIAVTNPWLGKAWGTDVYEGAATMNLPVGSLDFVMIRLGGTTARDIYIDPSFGKKVQWVWDAGAIPMAYWVVNGSWYPNHEYTVGNVATQTNDKHPILQAIQLAMKSGNTAWKKVGALFYDAELEAGGDVWDALYIDDLRGRIAGMSQQGQFTPGIRQGIYSRAGWVESHPHLKTLCENHPELIIWTANYMTSYPGKHMPIAEYRTNSLPMLTQRPFWFGDNPAKPKLYPRFWQYHGTFDGAMYSTCPEILGADGRPSGLDLNVCEATREDLFKAIGWVDPLTVPPPPPPVDPPPPETPDLTAILARLDALETVSDDQAARLSTLEAFRANVKGA